MAWLTERSRTDLEYHVVTAGDGWLEPAYELMSASFDASVLDPIDRYRDWLNRNALDQHEFPFLMVVAFVVEGHEAYLTGIIAGNIMSLRDRTIDGSPFAFFAIGHQLTLPNLQRSRIGTRLWTAALDEAQRQAEARGQKLWGSLLESEVDSMAFWSHLGYRWPQGTRYWQPPLEFDDTGQPLHAEVPEILMLRPLAPQMAVDRDLVLALVREIYQRWCLDRYEQVLSPAAMERARAYVMDEIWNRVAAKMPPDPQLRLVEIDVEGASHMKHVRTIALSQGVQHNLQPLRAPRVSEITSFDGMLDAMKSMAFGARTLGEAADVLYTMATEPGCRVVLTMAGAVSVAKLDLLIADMIERGLIHCIVTTGAIICHGFNSERGSAHFKAPPDADDTWLFEQGYNRIFDTIETEYALDELQDIIHGLLEDIPEGTTTCSADLTRQLGRYLVDKGRPDGLLQAAFRKNVPIFVPAFSDSEIGLDFAIFNHFRREQGRSAIHFDVFEDFQRYCDFVKSAETRGILTLGGGVPRNWAQQIGPYLDAIERYEHAVASKSVRFKYAVRICPDPPFWGGLSGCTYSEGVSWGKFVPTDEGGRVAEVLSDFSFVFPLLVKGLFERLERRG